MTCCTVEATPWPLPSGWSGTDHHLPKSVPLRYAPEPGLGGCLFRLHQLARNGLPIQVTHGAMFYIQAFQDHVLITLMFIFELLQLVTMSVSSLSFVFVHV